MKLKEMLKPEVLEWQSQDILPILFPQGFVNYGKAE